MKKVLITGGAGKIGAHFVRKHATEYEITVVDIKTSLIDFPENVRVIEADLTNYKACKEATEGMDIVIHLAGIIDETENDDALDSNSLLIKNVFKATAENKCD